MWIRVRLGDTVIFEKLRHRYIEIEVEEWSFKFQMSIKLKLSAPLLNVIKAHKIGKFLGTPKG